MTPDSDSPPVTRSATAPVQQATEAPRRATSPAEAGRAVIQEVGRVIVGKEIVLEKAFLGFLTGGHVLFEDYPGLAKTLMVKTFAQAVGLKFTRVQFTPDLLPTDITGTHVFSMKQQDFELRQGPVFTNILLADEINRAPPKTQAALLEAMAEGQTTLEGKTFNLPKPFLVFATQNPIETEGTYPLPEAQLDRFMMRLDVGYPQELEEVEILRRSEAWGAKEPKVRTVLDARGLLSLQEHARRVRASDDLKRYMAKIVGATRADNRLRVGASPRGSLALLRLSKALALIRGREYVVPDDVKDIAVEALAHRILLTGEARVRRVRPSDIVTDILNNVPLPPVERQNY